MTLVLEESLIKTISVEYLIFNITILTEVINEIRNAAAYIPCQSSN